MASYTIRIESPTYFVKKDNIKYFSLDFQKIPLGATITNASVTVLTNRTNYPGLDCYADLYYSIQQPELIQLTNVNVKARLEAGDRILPCSYSVRNLRLVNFEEWAAINYPNYSGKEKLGLEILVLASLEFSFKAIIDITYDYTEHVPKSKAYYLYSVNERGLSAIDCAIFYYNRKTTYEPDMVIGGEWLRCNLMYYTNGEWRKVYEN